MTETYLIRFTLRPGKREQFLELLGDVLDQMRHEKTFVIAHLSEHADRPDEFILHETWADRADVLEVQLNRSYRAAWHAALPDLLAKDREIEVLRPVWSAAK